MTSLGQNELIKDNKTATITCQSPTISSTSPKAYQYINDSCCPTRWRPNLLDLQHVCIVFTPDHCAATIFWIYRTTLAIWRRLRGTLTHHTQLENRYKIIIEPRKDGLQAHQGCIVQWKKFIETGSFNKTHKITSFGWHDLYNVLLPILREYQIHVYLTHWDWDKMAAISQATFWSAFSWMKMYEFRLKFHWSLFPVVQLTIFQHWFG